MGFSADEILDVVDADNRVTGQATRGEIHASGLLHRSVHVVLFNSAGQVFVQLRSTQKDTNPGLWDTSAAGHLDAGETPASAAVRELAEELGVVVDAASLETVGLLPPAVSNGMEFVQVYRVVSDAAITLEADEIDDGRWFELAVLRDRIVTHPEHYTTVLQQILSLLDDEGLPRGAGS